MAPVEERTAEQLRQEIDLERAQLVTSVESLRQELGIASKLRTRLPLATAGALGAGFVLAGGIGATIRLLFRRGRER
jgi:hypothetical protein